MRWPWRSSVNWAAPDHTCWKREKTQVWTMFHPRWENIHWTLCSHSTYYTTVSAWKAVWRHANRAESHAHQWSAFTGITCTKCESLRAGTLSETEVTAEDAWKSCEKDFGVGGRFAQSTEWCVYACFCGPLNPCCIVYQLQGLWSTNKNILS